MEECVRMSVRLACRSWWLWLACEMFPEDSCLRNQVGVWEVMHSWELNLINGWNCWWIHCWMHRLLRCKVFLREVHHRPCSYKVCLVFNLCSLCFLATMERVSFLHLAFTIDPVALGLKPLKPWTQHLSLFQVNFLLLWQRKVNVSQLCLFVYINICSDY